MKKTDCYTYAHTYHEGLEVMQYVTALNISQSLFDLDISETIAESYF